MGSGRSAAGPESEADRRRRTVSKLDPLKVLGGAAVGAAAMYVLDPDRGHRRRSMFRDRSRSVVRHEYRQANRVVRNKLVDTENRIEGAVIRARGGGRFHPESDVDLREHLRQVIANVDFSTKDVNIEAVRGVATLRGQVETGEQQERLITAVEKVPGVVTVRSYLHLPGDPAPNKEASRHPAASGT
jgi:BON domain